MRTRTGGRMFGTGALALGLLFVFAPPARAEETEVTEAELDDEIPELVVTATRVPTRVDDLGGGIDVLKLDDAALPQAGLAGLLRDLPGIDVQGGFFGEKPTINMRGLQGQFGTQRTLILMDGVPLNDAYLGDADLRFLGMGMIDRVEVVRGPGSALYGKSALGGVVNLISRRGGETPETEVSVMGGDHHTLGGTLSHGARVGELDYFVSAEALSTDGYIKNMDGTPRDWKGSSFGTRLGYALGDGAEIGLFAQFSTGKGEREFYLEDADHGNYWLSYRFESPASPGSIFTAKAYANAINQTLAWKLTGRTGLYDSVTAGLQVQQDFRAGSSHEITLGAEVRSDDIDVLEASGFSPAGSVKADSTVGAVYIQDSVDFDDRWSLILGARLDYQDEFGGELSPRVGVVRKLGEGEKLYTSVSKGYRAPSASDLHLPLINYGPFWYEGDPDLQPERHWAVEIGGTSLLRDRTRLGWSVFFDYGIDSWDYLLDDPGPPIEIHRPKNIGQTTLGAELDAEVKLAEGLALRASYTFVRATYDEYVPDPTIEGNLVEDMPEHSASVALARRWPGGWSVEVVGRFVGPRFTDPQNSSAGELDGFSLMDLGLTVPLVEGMSLNVIVTNVFDVDYAVSLLATKEPLPQPGRSVYAGMRAKF